MPRQEVDLSQLGVVSKHQGKFRARFQPRGFTVFSGPDRDSQKRAFEDLLVIQGAAAGHTTRIGGLQAMKEEAGRLKLEVRAESGGVAAVDNECRARFKYTDINSAPQEILGPRRQAETRAQTDLESIRAAGAGKTSRERYLEAMHAEAERLKQEAQDECGGVDAVINGYRARFRYIKGNGASQKNLRTTPP